MSVKYFCAPEAGPMYRITTKIGYLPLALGLSYILFTLFLFFISPFPWPIDDLSRLAVYMTAVFLALIAGYLFGSYSFKRKPQPLNYGRFIIIGGVASVVLLIPSSYVYAGRWPWQVLEALADQNAAYKSLGDQITEGSLSRAPIILVRTLLAPFIFCVIPLSVINWGKLKTIHKVSLLATIISSIIFSVLRGTTREVADIFIMLFSSIIILQFRQLSGETKFKFSTFYRNTAIVAFTLMLVIFSLNSRTGSRLGAYAKICIGDSGICADNLSPVNNLIPDSAYFLFSTVTGYFSQGYYGLYLSLNRDFESSLGLGHSPALLSLFKAFFNVEHLYTRTYIHRNHLSLWSADYQWSTMATWIANDIGFAGTLVVFVMLGAVWARSWYQAVFSHNDRAAVFFCVVMMMIFYFPANNQMMATLDSYATTLFWLVYWMSGRKQTCAT